MHQFGYGLNAQCNGGYTAYSYITDLNYTSYRNIDSELIPYHPVINGDM